ncbi:MAG: aminodeoxychorismate synthase component I [Candidatus Hinthialibacter antarcticus]|nr:aminodeoxychorismate synthase component I [Candidatus Hinthialibacter antarcticus]
MTSSPHACLAGPGWGLGHLGAQVAGFDAIIRAENPGQVEQALRELADYLRQGKIAVGFIAYEAAAAFGLSVNTTGPSQPLVWFGIASPKALQPFDEWPESSAAPSACDLAGLDARDYPTSIQRIKDYIAAGDSYQVNFTVRADASVSGPPLALFRRLYESQPCPYAAFIETGEQTVLSLSPELFLQRKGDQLLSRPMKGTMARGRFYEEDQALRRRLQESEKERAENIMIVDMMRNDLGRICKFGSVLTRNVYQTEPYRTLWQMTGEVAGTLRDNATLGDIIAATFPAASITGAPKRRTMQIIQELEPQPRGVYCGAVGLFNSERDFTLNVAIRTLSGIHQKFVLGLGGGIVWDSDVKAERNELDVKAKFISSRFPAFELLETLRYSSENGFAFLNEHFERLEKSAAYWQLPFHRAKIEAQLHEYTKQIKHDLTAVRLTLNQAGSAAISHRDVTHVSDEVVVRFSNQAIDSSDCFYFHKTTHRPLYNQERQKALDDGLFEILFVNERGCVTEGAITNLFYRMGEQWFTPPIEDGLLPGIWRAHFLNETHALERSIQRGDLTCCDEIRLGNSVFGDVRVNLVQE